jgi:hypothetical protein
MNSIPNLTDDPSQKQTVVLPDGSKLDLRIRYRQSQSGWYVDELVWGTFILRGLRITNSPNMLRQWKNRLPFGIACTTKGNREPTQVKDFESGDSVLYVLTAEEVDGYEDAVKEG